MFKNLVALVTGGASGLGRSTVDRLTQLGAKVVICDLPKSNGYQISKELGENVTFVPANVTKARDVQNVIDEIDRIHGRLNVVVNCAGIAQSYLIYNFKTNRPRDMKDFVPILKTNVLGSLNVIRLAVQLMGRNEPDTNQWRGCIVNTAGVEGIRGALGQAAIGAASGAIIAMTQPLAKDLLESGIRVVTIAPGFIESPLTDFLPVYTKAAISRNCMIAPKRFGEAQEYAHLVTTCIRNPQLNGTVIELDAGIDINF